LENFCVHTMLRGYAFTKVAIPFLYNWILRGVPEVLRDHHLLYACIHQALREGCLPTAELIDDTLVSFGGSLDSLKDSCLSPRFPALDITPLFSSTSRYWRRYFSCYSCLFSAHLLRFPGRLVSSHLIRSTNISYAVRGRRAA
jgi:hypothetical protein